jgi:phospholipid/cholesterol/gamma-HCH transport system permease protein
MVYANRRAGAEFGHAAPAPNGIGILSVASDARPGQFAPTPEVGRALGKAWHHIVMIPVHSAATTGRGMQLAVSTIHYSVRDTVTLRLPLGELVLQAWTLLKVTAIPAILMAIPFGGMVSVQASGLVSQVGATSLVGAGSAVAVIRQGAPIVSGLLMGGAAASAIASDLGARAIREELDALRAMGVNTTRHLVVPRFLALIVIAPILSCLIIAAAVAASFTLAVAVTDVTPGSFWMSFGTFASPVDVWFTMGKSVLFAAIVAIISCLRGMEAKGGPRGVADAVNSSVVLNVVCIAVANLAVTQLQVMFFPMVVS